MSSRKYDRARYLHDDIEHCVISGMTAIVQRVIPEQGGQGQGQGQGQGAEGRKYVWGVAEPGETLPVVHGGAADRAGAKRCAQLWANAIGAYRRVDWRGGGGGGDQQLRAVAEQAAAAARQMGDISIVRPGTVAERVVRLMAVHSVAGFGITDRSRWAEVAGDSIADCASRIGEAQRAAEREAVLVQNERLWREKIRAAMGLGSVRR